MKIYLKKSNINFFVILFLGSVLSKLWLNVYVWVATIIVIFFYFIILDFNKLTISTALIKEFPFFLGAGIAISSTIVYQQNIRYVIEILINILLSLLGYYMLSLLGDKYLKSGIQFLCILLAVVCVFGIFEYITKVNIFDNIMIGELSGYKNERIYGPFRHPIIYANCMLFGLIGFIFLFRKSVLQRLAILLIISNIILSGSRSSWLGIMFLGLMAICRVFYKMKIKLSKNSLIYSFLALFSIWLFYKLKLLTYLVSRIESVFGYNNGYQRIATIFYIIKNFVAGSIDNILIGNGSHAAADIMLKVTFQWTNFSTTDNLYISDLYNFGLVYIFIMCYYFLKIIKRFIKNSVDKLELMLESVLISFFVVFFFYEPFVHYPVSSLFFVSFGALLYKWNTSLIYT